LNSFGGGRFFSGTSLPGKFDVKEGEGNYHIAFTSSDGTTIAIDANKTGELNPDSIFQHTDAASKFFEGGSLGYSTKPQGIGRT